MSCKPTYQGERFDSEKDVLRTAANLNIDIDKNGEPILTDDIRKSLSNLAAVPPKSKLDTTGVAYSIQNTAAFQKANKASIDRLVNRLKKTGLATDVVFTGNFEAKVAPGNALTTPKGIVYGYVDGDNVVHLNPDVLNMNTPMHEFGHLWVRNIKTNMRPLWERGKELFRNSKYLKEVQASPFYKDKTLDEQIEEAMVRAIGDYGEGVLQEGILSKIKEWIAEVFTKIGTYFGIVGLSPEQISKLTMGTFTELATADLLSGRDLMQNILDETSSSRFRESYKPTPVNKKIGYKLFKVFPDGTLKPLYVDYKYKIPVGVWVDALEGGEAPPSKKGNRQVGSALGSLSYRPGWHLGDVPFETHIGKKMGEDKKEITHFHQDVIWAEVEYSTDIDYQDKAGRNGLQEIPIDGSYRFKTNQAMTGEWVIAGTMKVKRVISDTEANEITQNAIAKIREEYSTLTGVEKENAKQLLDAWDKHQGNLPREQGAIEQSYFDQINRLHIWERLRKTEAFRAPNTLKVSDAGFFSTVEVALEKVPQAKGTPAQMRSMMLMHGAKQAELDWMQWDRFTEGVTSITKSEIQEWIDANRIDVREIVHGGITEEDIDSLLEDEVGQDMTREEAREFLEGDEQFETSYPTFVLPGGEAYRELLLTIPGTTVPVPFKSEHFGEDNIVAHVRFDERMVNGERVLFIQEFQSDWAQKGKKEEFKKQHIDKTLQEWVKQDQSGEVDDVDWYEKTLDELMEKYNIDSDVDDLGSRLKEILDQQTTGIPDMPFRKTDQWLNLAVRRMMRYAAENGFDRIAWTTGEQQVERYDLSKQVDKIRYSKRKNENIYDIQAIRDGRSIINDGFKPEDIEGTFGKEIAQKILNGEGQDSKIEGLKLLVGDNLKIGGSGMKAFYDAIVPKNISNLGKAFGANIETIDLNNGFGFRMWEKASGKFIGEFKGGYYYTSINGEREYKVPADYKNPEQVAAEMGLDIANLTVKYDGQEGTGLLIQPSLPITDSMKQSARQGMPLYQVQNIELQQIKKEALKRGTFMKAPNGQPTNLNEFQWLQVRTTAFKDWFGDWENSPKTASKVVDKNGEPLVVYHGSLQRFTTFDPNRGFSAPNIFHASDLGVVTHWSGALTSSPVTFDDIEQVRALNTVEDVIKAANTLLGYPHNLEKYTYGWRLEGGNVSSPMKIKRNGESRFAKTQEELLEAVKEDIISSLSYLSTSERGRNYSNYLNIKNPLVVDAKKKSYHQIPFEGAPATANMIASIALERGHDGTIIKNVLETDYENSLTDDYVVSTPNQIKSATDNIGAFASADNDIRYQIIGEEGASRLSNAITVIENLNKAKAETLKGTDKLTIKKATGWELSGDSKWRYELPDYDFTVEDLQVDGKPLSEIWDDTELFKAYPALKDMPIYMSVNEAFMDDQGNYDKDLKNIFIFATNREGARISLIHEIQHFVQIEEGFAIGGNEYTVSDYVMQIREEIKDINFRARSGMSLPSDNARYKELRAEFDRLANISIVGSGYTQLAGEAEARNAENRSRMTMAERANSLLSDTDGVAEEDKIYLMNEIFQGTQQINNIANKNGNNQQRQGWVRSKRRSQEADTKPVTSEGETSKSGFGLVRATESREVNEEVVYNGEYKQAVGNENSNVVTIDGETINKDKVLVEAPANTTNETVQALNLDKPYENVDDIDDNLLYDEVYNGLKLHNVEPSDTEVLGMAAHVKKHIGNSTLGAAVQKAISLFTAKKTPSPVTSNVNPNAKGNTVTTPNTTYNEAVKNKAYQTGANLWIRNDKSETNEDRVLLVQFSSNMLYGADRKFVRSKNSRYFDTVYRLVEGYNRTSDFWEVPLWIARTAGLEAKSDVYIVRNQEEADKFIKEAGYGRVVMSVMDVTYQNSSELMRNNPNQIFEAGDYTNRPELKAFKNVSIFNSMDDYISNHNLQDTTGYSYKHFEGTSVIPRLKMSEGCAYKCAFCSIPKALKKVSQAEIDKQVDEIIQLDAELIYLDDKTFGQVDNFTYLDQVYSKVKEKNPNFKGFIVQTTAVDFQDKKRFSKEWLDKAHIQFVELGIETYNDDILTTLNKRHSHAKFVNAALQNARENNIKIIANIIVGLSWKDANGAIKSETKESYTNTMNFIRANSDVISHMNVYALALYEGTNLADEIDIKAESDTNENVVLKSFHGDPEVHQWAMDEFSQLGIDLVESKVTNATTQPELLLDATVNESPMINKDEMNKLTTQLNKAFGGRVKVIQNINDIPVTDAIATKLKNTRGIVYGAVTEDGTIYLNPDYLNANTAIHEHGHLFNQIISKTNPTLWRAIVEASKQTAIWAEIQGNPDYADLTTDDQVADEVFSRILGKFGEGKWEQLIAEVEDRTIFDTLKEYILEFIDSIKSLFGVSKYDEMTAEDLAETSLRKLLSGKPLTKRGELAQIRADFSSLLSHISSQNTKLGFLGGFRLSTDEGTLSNEQKRELFKKAFGEEASRLIFSHTPYGFDRPTQYITFLNKVIPVKAHIPFILKNHGTAIEREFKATLEGGITQQKDAVEKRTPEDILKEVGYSFNYTPTGTDVLKFRGYYPADGVNGRDVICTFNDPYGRAQNYFVSFIVKDDAEQTVRAEELTQTNLSPSWKQFLENNGRKNADGTYNLTNLKSHREDPFSTSVLSIQIHKQGKELKVISRYNHTIESGTNRHPDSVYEGNLDAIAEGLYTNLYSNFHVEDKRTNVTHTALPDNIKQDVTGRYFQYSNEQNGVYWGEGFYMRGGDSVILDPATERVANGILYNSMHNKAYDISLQAYLALFQDIEKVTFLKGGKTELLTALGKVVFTSENGTITSIDSIDPKVRFDTLKRLYSAEKLGGTNEIILNRVNGISYHPHAIDFLWGEDITKIKYSADFEGSNLKSLLNLRYIGLDLTIHDSQISSLGALRYIGGDFILDGSPLTSLGNLRKIKGDFSLRSNPNIISLGALRHIGGYANFAFSRLLSLGNLRIIEGSANFVGTKLQSLGNLKYIGKDAEIRDSDLVSLGNLKIIGRNAFIKGDKIESLGSLKYIGGRAGFQDSSIKSLGALQYIYGGADFTNTKITSLGNLLYVGGATFITHMPNLKSLGALLFIDRDLFIDSDNKLTSLDNLEFVHGDLTNLRGNNLASLGNLKYVGGSFISSDISQKYGVKDKVDDLDPILQKYRNLRGDLEAAMWEETRNIFSGKPTPNNIQTNVDSLFNEFPQFEAVGTKEQFSEFVGTYYPNHNLEFAANKEIEFDLISMPNAPVKMGAGVYTFPTKSEANEVQPNKVQFALVDQMDVMEYSNTDELLRKAKNSLDSVKDFPYRDPITKFVQKELLAGRSIKVGTQTVSPLISAKIVDDNSILREFEAYVYLETSETVKDAQKTWGEFNPIREGISTTIAPFQEETIFSTEEANDFFKSRDFLDLTSKALRIASMLKLPNPHMSKNIGGYRMNDTDITEVSITFNFDTTHHKAVDKFTTLISSIGLHSQESAISVEYVEEDKANGLEISMQVYFPDQVLEILADEGIRDFTLDYSTSTLTIIAFHKQGTPEEFTDKINNLISKLKYHGNFQRVYKAKPVICNFITEGVREKVYQEWDADAKKGNIDGELLDVIEEAKQADTTFKERHTSRALISGSQAIQRLARPEEQGRIRGGERALEYTLLLRGLTRDVQKPQSKDEEFSLYKEQEKVLLAHAKRNGSYFPIRDIVKGGALRGEGESSVVYSGEANNVIKVFDPKSVGDIMDALDNTVAQFNRVFPSTAVKVLGVTEENGELRLLLEQKLIPIMDRVATQKEINDYMISKGFIPSSEGIMSTFSSPEHYVSDLHPNNIVFGTDGNLYVIDAYVSYNDTNAAELGMSSDNPLPFEIVEAKLEPATIAPSPLQLSAKGKDVISRKSSLERLGEAEVGRVALGKLGVELTLQLAGYENAGSEQNKVLNEYATINKLYTDSYEELAPNQMLISSTEGNPLDILDSLTIYNTLSHIKARVAGIKRVGALGHIGFIVEVNDSNYEPVEGVFERLGMAVSKLGYSYYNKDYRLNTSNLVDGLFTPKAFLSLNTSEQLGGVRKEMAISTEIRTNNNINKPTINCN